MTPDQIIAEEATRAGLTVNDITGIKHDRWRWRARREVAARLRDLGMSYAMIGAHLGNRSHDIIISILRTHRKDLRAKQSQPG